MKTIEMPAWRLTADCIWNAFRNSGKKHLFLTGNRGIGKTTLLEKLTGKALPGITSWAEREKGVWLKENTSGKTAQIGIFNPTAVYSGNPMYPMADGFVNLGIPALRRCVDLASEWVSVDEIGYLETAVPEYCRMLLELMEKKHVIAVLRKQDTPFLNELKNRLDAFVIDLDDPFGNIGCVIMASGLGRRFGGNKLNAEFQGVRMIERCIEATADVPCRVVVTRHWDVAEYCQTLSIPTVLHDFPYRSDTVRLGLEAIPGIDACMFCPGDQPLLTRETIDALMLLAKAEPGMIRRPGYDDHPGAPVLFPQCFFAELLTLPEGKGGGIVVKKHPECVRILNIRDQRELMDVDTPEELKLLSDRLD